MVTWGFRLGPLCSARTASRFSSADADKNFRADRAKEWLNIHGRLSPGVSVEQASAAVAAVTAQLAKAYPATNEFKAGIAGAYDPLGILQRPQFRIIQTVGLTLTGMVLLVVSLNISGMMQVRGAMRERELSIRQAIGASRGRLVQYLLSESIVLAGAGGRLPRLCSSTFRRCCPGWIGRADSASDSRRRSEWICRWSRSVSGSASSTSLVFGWLPAMRFSRPVIISSLKDDAGGGGLRVGRVHRVTAALQVAIAVPLLVMSGMSLDRVRATATSDLGFASDLLYAAPLKLDAPGRRESWLPDPKASDTLANASGVASVTVADGLPLDFRGRSTRVSLQDGRERRAEVRLPST